MDYGRDGEGKKYLDTKLKMGVKCVSKMFKVSVFLLSASPLQPSDNIIFFTMIVLHSLNIYG